MRRPRSPVEWRGPCASAGSAGAPWATAGERLAPLVLVEEPSLAWRATLDGNRGALSRMNRRNKVVSAPIQAGGKLHTAFKRLNLLPFSRWLLSESARKLLNPFATAS